MKKLIAILIALAMVLSGCGNASLVSVHATYQKVHVDTPHFNGCLTVERWYLSENDTGFECDTLEAGNVWLSEGTYILLDGTKPCPFCND